MKNKEKIIKWILSTMGFMTVAITLAILVSLLGESYLFFRNISIVEFFTGKSWTPLLSPKTYGVLPLIAGTLIIVIFSSLISLPIGLLSAIYLSEYCPKNIRRILKPILEILAGIPSIVYGFFALNLITPFIRSFWENTNIYNGLSAAIAVGIMTIPMVLSLSEDAMQAVPNSLREGAYALGLTKLEVIRGVVIPAAISGILTSFVLAISRAIGETMIVALAAGSTPNFTLNPLESIQTMTGYIVQVSTGDIAAGSIEEQTLYAVAMVLFFMTLGMNILSSNISKRFREEY